MKGVLHILICILIILFKSEGINVDITYLNSTAVLKGAVCLDGSAPAYYFDKGFGAGTDNWLVHLEGGAWCNNTASCSARRDTKLGSSKKMNKTIVFSGIFSNKTKFNPDFFNWNRVRVQYCDGASFTGDVEAVNNATNLYYRGERIYAAVMDDLLARGMKNARNAILSGCSAGGLAAILHCDNFTSYFDKSVNVKCLSDAGFFINAKDITNVSRIENFFNDVVNLHGSANNLPQACTSIMNPPSLCFFPENVVGGIRTPLFVVNAAYDSWQIKNILAPGAADPHGLWKSCKVDITKCSASHLQTMQDFHTQLITLATKALNTSLSNSNGYFINSCYSHCQTGTQATWLRSDSPLLKNTTIAKAVGDWFYNRNRFMATECPYPCDKTCHNRIFDSDAQPMI